MVTSGWKEGLSLELLEGWQKWPAILRLFLENAWSVLGITLMTSAKFSVGIHFASTVWNNGGKLTKIVLFVEKKFSMSAQKQGRKLGEKICLPLKRTTETKISYLTVNFAGVLSNLLNRWTSAIFADLCIGIRGVYRIETQSGSVSNVLVLGRLRKRVKLMCKNDSKK